MRCSMISSANCQSDIRTVYIVHSVSLTAQKRIIVKLHCTQWFLQGGIVKSTGRKDLL